MPTNFTDLHGLRLEILANQVVKVSYQAKVSIEVNTSSKSLQFTSTPHEHDGHLIIAVKGEVDYCWAFLIHLFHRGPTEHLHVLSSWWSQLIGDEFEVVQRKGNSTRFVMGQTTTRDAIIELYQLAENDVDLARQVQM